MSEFIDVKEIFGENVFNDSAMKARLPKKVYQELRKTMEEGKGFDPRKLLAPGAAAIKATVKEKMEIFGSVNKA